MSVEFSIELLELKKDMLFAGGTALSDIAPEQSFTHLYEVTSKQRKLLIKVDLNAQTLISNGEPLDSASKGDSILIGLSGASEPVIEAVKKLRWQRKSGRYLRTTKADIVLASE